MIVERKIVGVKWTDHSYYRVPRLYSTELPDIMEMILGAFA